MKHFLDSLIWRNRGVTGLETAIILIAFVVVASVFAFTVLSTGIFSTERGKETIFAGHEQVTGNVELKGAVVANGVADQLLSDAETAWNEVAANASASRDSSDKKVGSYSGELTVGASKTGLLAYEIISPALDLTSYDSVRLWLKSDTATSEGALRLRISDDGTDCGTGGGYEDISLPTLAANTWKLATAGIAADTTRSQVACVGLVISAGNAYSSQAIVNFDDIEAQGQVTSLVFAVANSVDGLPVDLTQPSDADDDGITDGGGRQHQLLITYFDDNQIKNDLYWTRSFIGTSDSDDLLEQGERAELTVYLKGLDQATPLVADKEFAIEVKPSKGSILSIQRATPARIDRVMNLK